MEPEEISLVDRLSISRVFTGWIAAIVAAGIWYRWYEETYALVALVALFLYGGITDYADGKIARKRGLLSSHGGRLDAWCDKMEKFPSWIVYALLGWVPLWLVLPVLFRDMVSGGYREVMPQGVDKGDADMSGKVKTWAQYFVLGGAPLSRLFGWETGWYFAYQVAILFLAVVTFWATVSFLRLKGPRSVQYLRTWKKRRKTEGQPHQRTVVEAPSEA